MHVFEFLEGRGKGRLGLGWVGWGGWAGVGWKGWNGVGVVGGRVVGMGWGRAGHGRVWQGLAG